MGQSLLYDLRTALFVHIQSLSLKFHSKSEVGRVMSRIQNDVQQLQEFISIIALAIADILMLGGIILAMLLMKWDLALLVLITVPILMVAVFIWQRYAWRSFMKVRRAMATVNANLQENISGVRIIQSLNRTTLNVAKFDKLNHDHLVSGISASKLGASLLPTIEIVTAITFAMTIIIGGVSVINGHLDVGGLVAFALFIQRFFEPLRSITMQYAGLQRAMTSGHHIFELMDIRPDITDKPGALALPTIRGEIRFEHVYFYYEENVPVLNDVDVLINSGDKVALVGATGAGKTTFVSLVSRFYDPTAGRITIDNIDIRDMTRASFSKHTGTVTQDPFLFSGTIKDNIIFSHPDVTEEQLVEAARTIGAHDFISRLEFGYNTVIEERGSNLSPGERQLISLTRAIIGNPSIVILDEATATVDSHTEKNIQIGLDNLLAGRTAIIIAHRLSTVRNVDRIFVMDQGRIIEQGNHRELLSLGGTYAQLHSLNYASELLSDD